MTNIELIELTLSQIGRIAHSISKLQDNCFYLKSKHDYETFAQLEARHKEALNRCRLALRDVLEDIANHQNDICATTGVDIALGEVAFDLIYERKTEDDFNDE